MEDLSRRGLLKAILQALPAILIRVPFLPLHYGKASAEIKALRGRTIGEAFAGESLYYRIGFWWFRDAARGRIAFQGRGGHYTATVEAETLGIIGWLTRYRRDIYHTYMEEIEGGRRLRTYFLEKRVNIGGRVREGYLRADYQRRVIEWRSWGGGRPERKGRDPIPEGMVLDDPIGAFYNFRYGAYGPIKEGREYRIATFPKDGKIRWITIRVATEEEKTRRLRANRDQGVAYLVDLKVDKEIIGSKSGRIEVMFDRDLVPVKGVVRDVFFFGDVRGSLVKAEAPGKRG